MRIDLIKSKKHRRFDVVWNAAREVWEIAETNVVVIHEVTAGKTKRAAIQQARRMARDERAADPTIVFTHNHSGRIGKGGNAEASFRCDSKRSKG